MESSNNRVCIVKSRWPLSKIKSFISKYGEVKYLRVIYDNTGNETRDLSIVLIPKEALDLLEKEGFCNRKTKSEILVFEYLLKENSYPKKGVSSNTLFVPIPPSLQKNDDCISFIAEKMESLAFWDVIPKDSWKIKFGFKSREKGDIRSGCFIMFNDGVALERIIFSRILLTDTYWFDDKDVFKCFWARKQKTQKIEVEKKLVTDPENKKKERFRKIISRAKLV
jgi:hypothetical protein